jgi:hypothetical protein
MWADRTRNKPIGALHRVIWLHIPGGFRTIDQRLTNGRLSVWIEKLAHTLWNDRQPLVMVSLEHTTFHPCLVLVWDAEYTRYWIFPREKSRAQLRFGVTLALVRFYARHFTLLSINFGYSFWKNW